MVTYSQIKFAIKDRIERGEREIEREREGQRETKREHKHRPFCAKCYTRFIPVSLFNRLTMQYQRILYHSSIHQHASLIQPYIPEGVGSMLLWLRTLKG